MYILRGKPKVCHHITILPPIIYLLTMTKVWTVFVFYQSLFIAINMVVYRIAYLIGLKRELFLSKYYKYEVYMCLAH